MIVHTINDTYYALVVIIRQYPREESRRKSKWLYAARNNYTRNVTFPKDIATYAIFPLRQPPYSVIISTTEASRGYFGIE